MPGFLETQVANLLEKVLGPFVIGLDKQSLNLSVWSGEVLLRDLQLRTEALDALPIPVKAIGGTVGEVRVTVPWRRLGKEPLIISIDRVFLLVGPRADTEGYSEAEEKEMAERTKRDALEAWEATQDKKADDGGVRFSYDLDAVRALYDDHCQTDLLADARALDDADRLGLVIAGKADVVPRDLGLKHTYLLEESGHNVHVDALPELLDVVVGTHGADWV